MMQAYGLRSHIWNNNLRSIILLVMFPVLLLFVAFAIMLLWGGYATDMGAEQGIDFALQSMPAAAPIALGASAAWFGVAFFGHQAMISAATKSKSVSQSDAPRPYKLLENLCITRGMTVPRLKLMRTPVMNAYASGIKDSNYTITLTTGLLDNLDDEELEAVIAHELTHIKNNDVRLLIIAVIFVGIFSFVGEAVFRGMMRTNLPRNDHHRRSGGGNAGALIFFGMAIIALSYLFAILTRFALSRKREYMADAGAVELTKNPDAMIRALQKISGNAEMKGVPAEVREMAFENPRTGFAGIFATHPPISKRIDALVKFAGGRIDSESQPAPRTRLEKEPETPKERRSRNPWRWGR
ncbi:MAG: M48 family metallopeptidase [Hellea sp.]|nr:M48 family metallopeptidase [Hellea sp.]